jgi:O-antigen biosynthesis protein
MQQLQKPVLNKFQPGIIPIFIVSPNINDGDSLALLLSNEVVAKNLYKTTTSESHHKNYFFSEEVRKLSEKNLTENTKKNKEYRTALKFILSKGFDSKHLWGLQLDYRLFFELDAGELFPEAFFIFQYGTRVTRIRKRNSALKEKIEDKTDAVIPKPEIIISDEEYLRKVYQFHIENNSTSILLHVNNAFYLPKLLLRSFSFDSGFTIRESFKLDEVRITRRKNEPFLFKGNSRLERLKEDLTNSNLLAQNNQWLTGNEITIVLILSEGVNEDALLKKTEELSESFFHSPLVKIICKSENDKRSAQRLLADSKQDLSNIEVATCYTNIASTLNEIINSTSSDYFIIDNVSLSYSIESLISPLTESEAPAFTFGNLSSNRINELSSAKLSLIDMLAISAIPVNIAFAKKTWEEINGFDNSFENKIAIWDFTIRALQIQGNYAVEISAVFSDNIAGNEALENKMIPFEGYNSILQKHGSLFEKKLNQIIKSFSEKLFAPQFEIKKLNQKNASVQSLLAHSKDEIRSLNNLVAEFQQRIHLYEGRWHFKLANKFDRLRKIFFKKKTPGTSKIKKFLKFIVFAFSKPGFRIVRRIFKNAFRGLYLFVEDRKVEIVYLDNPVVGGIHNYNDWINSKLNHVVLKNTFDKQSQLLKHSPKISIVMPVYDPPTNYLNEAIESVINQLYGNWELCIADDCSPNPQIKRILEAYSLKDNRIKIVFRKENGHISASSNSALELATGEYILFMDHDDLLTANCCSEVVYYLNEHPEHADIIYSDEDKVEGNTFTVPHFKPDWAPDNLLSRNYFGHVVVMKKKIVDTIKGFRLGFEGSQDYDLILRATEQTNKIGHIDKVLYHWRIHDKSAAQGEDVKPYAYIAAKKALEEALVRRNTPGEVKYLSGLRGYQIKYDVLNPGKVTIIIPTKDHIKLLQNTIDSVINKTSYSNYEIIVINNNSVSKEFFEMMDEYKQKHPTNFQCIDANFPFNFSKLMNIGVAKSTGEYILLLNNDVEVIHDDWMTRMVSYAQYEKTGAVGAKLLYPDDNIQHAGVIIGLGGVAGHSFVNYYKDDAGYFNYIQSTNNYSAVTAACLMVRKSAYLEVGGFDESFEVEYNDVDFCLKLVDHGFYNVYMPDVELYHYESATRGHPHQSKESWERHIKEINLFKGKWQKFIDHDPYYNQNLRFDVHDFQTNLNS